MKHSRSIVAVRIIAVAGLLALTIIGVITMENKIAIEKREAAFLRLDDMACDLHGGYYLSDDSTVLNVNELESYPLGIAESRLVRVHKAQYSLKELRDLQERYDSHMQEWHIQSLGVDFPANRMEIVLYNAQPGDEAQIRAFAPDENMLLIRHASQPIKSLMGEFDPPIHATDKKVLRTVNGRKTPRQLKSLMTVEHLL